jgi:hydroxyethylthiazole kinase-like uncharacterized protein yjeF
VGAAYPVPDIRAAESVLLASHPEGAPMARAAAAVAAACARILHERAGRVAGRAVVLLVGRGNNGGDALFAGARLAVRGVAVTAVLTAADAHPQGLAAARAAGVRVVDALGVDGPAAGRSAVSDAALVVDGLVGLGGTAGLREPAAALVAAVPAGVPVVAVDLPSGIDPTTGQTPGPHVRADLTLAMGAMTPGLLLPPGCAAAGRLRVVDVGLTADLPEQAAVERLTPRAAGRHWPVPAATDDKYRRGVLGIVAGSAAYPGAAVLSCGGALRAGVGMVRYRGPEEAARQVIARWPEVVVGPGRVQAWMVGSGMDLDLPVRSGAGSGRAGPDREPSQREAVRDALDSGLPCVLDAGAISLCPTSAGPPLLLTPHAGELARLLTERHRDTAREDVERRPLEHARRAAGLTGATVLLKGATTLVVPPDGPVRSQSDGPPWLATAGSGDVLAGIAGALLAAGLDPLDAGSVAALVHGLAAVRACPGGPVTAGAVADAVPGTVAAVLDAAGRGWAALPAGGLED